THYARAEGLTDQEVWSQYELDKRLGQIANYALEAFGSPLPFLDVRVTNIISNPKLVSDSQGLKHASVKEIAMSAYQYGYYLVSQYDTIVEGIKELVDSYSEDSSYSGVHNILRFDKKNLVGLPLSTIDPTYRPVDDDSDGDILDDNGDKVPPQKKPRTKEIQELVDDNKILMTWIMDMRSHLYTGTVDAKRLGVKAQRDDSIMSESDEAIWLHGFMVLGMEMKGLLIGEDGEKYRGWVDSLGAEDLGNLERLKAFIKALPDKYEWIRSLHPIMTAMPGLRLHS
ncbi:hypothetical protein P7C70_g9641, partial [Phenoliferia sp. Uapishka_3]